MRRRAHDHEDERVAGVQRPLVVLHLLAVGHRRGFRGHVHVQHFAAKVHVIHELVEQFLRIKRRKKGKGQPHSFNLDPAITNYEEVDHGTGVNVKRNMPRLIVLKSNRTP